MASSSSDPANLSRRTFLSYCAASASLIATSSTRAQDPNLVDAKFAEIFAAVPGIMQRENVPGLQIALIREGEVAAVESFGIANIDTETLVTGDTLFETASLTKPVFAYVVMKLAEDGVLDLDTPLADIVEAPASGPPELVRALTARLVLSHRTGLPNWYTGKDKPSLKPSQGRLFAYSGMAYVYLQHVVEKLTQHDLPTLMRTRLFEPLGMKAAYLSPREFDSGQLAYGHTPSGRAIRSQLLEPSAAASLVCTARDYARFAAIIARPPAPSESFLKPETLQEAFKPCIEAAPRIQWGLGWGLQMAGEKPDSCFHWGNNYNAFNCFVVVNPYTRDGAVVMTNSGNGLRACAEIVPKAVPGNHPALRWDRVVGR